MPANTPTLRDLIGKMAQSISNMSRDARWDEMSDNIKGFLKELSSQLNSLKEKPILNINTEQKLAWYKKEKAITEQLQGRELTAKQIDDCALRIMSFKPLNEIIDDMSKKMEVEGISPELLEVISDYREQMEQLREIIKAESEEVKSEVSASTSPPTMRR